VLQERRVDEMWMIEKLKWWQTNGINIKPTITKSKYEELMLLQTLGWRCTKRTVHHERNVREEQRQYICGTNKQ